MTKTLIYSAGLVLGMEFKVVKNIKECERLWKKFSPQETLWDLWEVVSSFYDSKLQQPFFVVSVENGKETGLLPLWYDENKEYHFFGGEYPENRKFWINRKYFMDFVYEAPESVYLLEVNKDEPKKIAKESYWELDYPFKQRGKRYFINLEKFDYDVDKYLGTFSKKHRKNLRH